MRSVCKVMPGRVSRFENPFEHLLDTVLGAESSESGACGKPPVVIREDATGFVVEADVPGVKIEDLEVLVKDNELILQGERKAVAPAEGAAKSTVHRQETGAGKFRRAFAFNVDVHADGVEAHLADGVLTLRIPKALATQPKKIVVKGA